MSFLPDSTYNWQIVTSTPTPISITNHVAYLCKAGTSPLQFRLPTNSPLGFAFKIVGNSNLWQILQNANQFIKVGESSSTVGSTGSIKSTKLSDEIWVVCVTQNIEFKCFPALGNPILI